MKVGSLFSGIGGLELGLERAGMTVRWQVEKDEYARRVLEKHWPEVERFDDVRSVGARNLKPVDVICGGFPCQDISVAGKGKGIGGERSGLWKEFARIIGELKPSWIVIENVPALRSRGMEVVLQDLSSFGYDAEWDCFRASDFGAPHKRERVFIVAYPECESLRLEQGRCGRQNGQRASVFGFDGNTRALVGGVWPSSSGVCRVAHGVPNRVDRLRCLGNAVVPRVAEHIGKLIMGVMCVG